MNYDIIVVGGGHAGCEASYAAAKMGFKVALITSNINNVADMACNPSIGGTAKGIVVREIDAIGGLMGKIADHSHIQIKLLNHSKGPAVRALRAQIDKIVYPKKMLEVLKSTNNLDIIESMVEDLIIKNNTIKGLILENKEKIFSKAVILTTGTYLKSKILIGSESKLEGPHGERRSNKLSDNLKKYGFEIIRLKTGTPPRIKKSTIDFSKLKIENGDQKLLFFSFDSQRKYDIKNQQPCYITYTNENTHEIIKNNLNLSSMYGGFVKGVGPRYCPSIEDKIVRFFDREKHQLFLEPESIYYDDYYLQGFSTSMPIEVQEKMVHSLVGLEKAKILKHAYAIEYDAINSLQIKPTLETKIIRNLYAAGQINGTSGYEEAAGQGLIAGINASLKLKKMSPLILKRSESYIGVLIDDLVTKGTLDPYRLLTSRAEHRLLLRHDNADLRLRKYGYQAGLISKNQYELVQQKENQIEELLNILEKTRITKNSIPELIKNKISPEISSGYSLYELLKRPEIKIGDYLNSQLIPCIYNESVLEQVEIHVKYEGYINKAYQEVEKLLKLENKKIPENIDYDKVNNLASEAKQKLKLIRPLTIAQATRISGVNPTDISMLAIYLKKEYGKNENN